MKNFGQGSKSRGWAQKQKSRQMVARIVGGIDDPRRVKYTVQELCQVSGALGVQYWDEDLGPLNAKGVPMGAFSERIAQAGSVNSLDFKRGMARIVLAHPLQQR